MAAPDPGRIITFYSYKGGTGRSLALANVAWILASNGRRVLVVDWDLEAPGLHRYFRPFLIDHELTASDGLIEMVDRYASRAIGPVSEGKPPDPRWFIELADPSSYVLSIDFNAFPSGGKIDLLPAGRQSDNYALTINAFNWQNFYDRLGGGGFFEAFKRHVRRDYDYVLIDSRTGVSDTAGICTAQMPDSLVVCFTYNNQGIQGAAAVARSSLTAREKHLQERVQQAPSANQTEAALDIMKPLSIFPVAMRVDPGESDRLALRQALARKVFEPLIGHVEGQGQYFANVEVPHRPVYSYEEVLAPFKEEAQDPKSAFAALLRLTGYLTKGTIETFPSQLGPKERQAVLDAYAGASSDGPSGSRVSAPGESDLEIVVRNADRAIANLSPADRELAKQVLLRLVQLGERADAVSLSAQTARLADFSDAQTAMIGTLSHRGALTCTNAAQGPEAETIVAFADERLVQNWQTLKDWASKEREFLQCRQNVRALMQLWQREKTAAALLHGALRSDAKRWLSQRPEQLSADERRYIEASGWAHTKTTVQAVMTIAVVVGLGVAGMATLTEVRARKRLDAAVALQTELVTAQLKSAWRKSDCDEQGKLLATLALASRTLNGDDNTAQEACLQRIKKRGDELDAAAAELDSKKLPEQALIRRVEASLVRSAKVDMGPQLPLDPRLQLTLRGHAVPVRNVAVSSDGRTIFSAADDQVIVWDTETGQRRPLTLAIEGIPRRVVVARVGEADFLLVAYQAPPSKATSAEREWRLAIWEPTAFAKTQESPPLPPTEPDKPANDGKSGKEGTSKDDPVKPGIAPSRIISLPDEIEDFALLPSGKQLVAVASNGVTLLSLPAANAARSDARVLRRVDEHQAFMHVALSPTSDRVAAFGYLPNVRTWSTTLEGEAVDIRTDLTNVDVFSAAFHPTSAQFALGLWNGTLVVAPLQKDARTLVQSLPQPDKIVATKYCSDGSYLIVARRPLQASSEPPTSANGASVFRYRDSVLQPIFGLKQSLLRDAVLTRDCQRLITAWDDATVRVSALDEGRPFSTDAQTLLDDLRRRLGYPTVVHTQAGEPETALSDTPTPGGSNKR